MVDAALKRRFRLSAALVMLGLAVELVSLTWRHPTAFLVFVLIGGTLLCTGMGVYLSNLLSKGA